MSLVFRSRRRRPRRFAFLDRDGVLNTDCGYPADPAQLELIPGAAGLCRRLRRRGYALVVVTNQSGLARGYFSERQYLRFTAALRDRLRRDGAHLDLVLPCPHLATGSVPAHARWCVCRKPRPGLLTRALRQYRGRARESLMVGDSARDIRAARQAGVRRGYRFLPGHGHRRMLNPPGVTRVRSLDSIRG